MRLRRSYAVILQTILEREPVNRLDLIEESGYADVDQPLYFLRKFGCVVGHGRWRITERGRIALLLWQLKEAHLMCERKVRSDEMDLAWNDYFGLDHSADGASPDPRR